VHGKMGSPPLPASCNRAVGLRIGRGLTAPARAAQLLRQVIWVQRRDEPEQGSYEELLQLLRRNHCLTSCAPRAPWAARRAWCLALGVGQGRFWWQLAVGAAVVGGFFFLTCGRFGSGLRARCGSPMSSRTGRPLSRAGPV